MAFGLALPKFKELKDGDVAATFIVPAPQGCNLNCSFCVIRSRREASEQTLTLRNYVEFLENICHRHSVGLVSLQGYEPLLPESWKYSKAILERGRDLGIDTALVTNGTHLENRVSDLVRLEIMGIAVSLDSADPDLHDATRRTPGAFAATLRGLKAACESQLRERIMVASVLQHDKANYLWDMPQFLASLGIRQWVVTPVYKVGHHKAGAPSGRPDTIVFQLRRLNKIAREHGIDLVIDDEFSDLVEALDHVTKREVLRVRRLKRPYQVIRLSPNGTCSSGKEIVRRVDAGLPQWRPEVEAAGDFIRRTLSLRINSAISTIPLALATAEA